MEFRWNRWNVEHIARHGVLPTEAEEVVLGARPPYPRYRGDERWLVWGRSSNGRPLQVVFLLDEDDFVFVIHARPLTDKEKRRHRRESKI